MDYLQSNDAVLIDLLNQSDVNAFNAIYQRYWEAIFKYAVGKVHTQQIAEDLCQDVFLSLWNRRGDLSVQNLQAYLFTAAKFSLLKHIRSQIYQRGQLVVIRGTLTATNDTENAIHLKALLHAWEVAVAELPLKTQEVFRLSSVEGFTNKQIASRLQLSEKAVEYHITKSYKSIRLQLRDFAVLLLLLFYH
ncbi:MAG TPA: sigma-70 family RNA polymerase sigma factor [Chitinophagaceae bacterium]|nr:sigma-70 family RNA polymerase sigma factor [Chitinophagaceae bacterium]